MTLTNSNYFSPENNMKFMGSSQFRTFFLECEAKALAEAKGEYKREKTTSMLVGSYVDAYYEDSLDDFKLEYPEIFLKNGGGLKSDFKKAEIIIARLQRDELFSKYMSGDKQTILTGEIEGIPCKIKIDSYHPGKAIVDLKVVKDFKPEWSDGLKYPLLKKSGYDIQGAFYQEIEGNKLPFFLAGATKETVTDLEIINIPQQRLDVCMDFIRKNIKRYDDIKKGLIEPKRCERCNYCKSTKKLTKVISYEDIGD